MTPGREPEAVGASEDEGAPEAGVAPPTPAGAVSEGRLTDRRRGRARGSYVDPRAPEPVLLRQAGREKGGSIYLDATTLREALAKTRIPIETAVRDLEVYRKILGGHPNEAQVLLVIRVRKGAGT